jgi:hypothetical protein
MNYINAFSLSVVAALALGCSGQQSETRQYPMAAQETTAVSELLETTPAPSTTVEEYTTGTEIHSLADESDAVASAPHRRTFTVMVRHAENLVSLAELAKTSVDEIASINALDDFDALRAGDELQLPIPDSVGSVEEDGFIAMFEEDRIAARQVRVDRFESQKGGVVGVESYRVKTGDNAWTLATKEFEVPLWVLSHYNPDVNMESLRIGQQIQFPSLAANLEQERLSRSVVASMAPATVEEPVEDLSGPDALDIALHEALMDEFERLDEEPVTGESSFARFEIVLDDLVFEDPATQSDEVKQLELVE